MALYRLRLELKAPLGTKLTSGTIFGHLCWAFREAHGEAALESWLGGLAESPWAVSDGFPAEHLPRPQVPPAPPVTTGKMTAEKLRDLEAAKKRRKLAFIPRASWQNLRIGLTAARLDEAACDGPMPREHRIAHNTIDRRTATTPETGGLWFVDEFWPKTTGEARNRSNLVDVYVRADASADDVGSLFRAVGEAGYGRDASTGRGLFSVAPVARADDLDGVPPTGGSVRMLSLSHGSLTANMGDACYRLTTHFGKVGRTMLATLPRPWKLPILLARPGATFAPADSGPFGAWLTGVHQDRPGIGHNAFHLAIPFTFAGLR